MNLLQKIEEASRVLQPQLLPLPKVALVLGSGWGSLVENFEDLKSIPFREVPHMKSASVEGHVGEFCVGKWMGIPLVCLRGRLHGYEGHSLEEVVFPVRLLASLGVEIFLLTNASGGIHPDIRPPELLLITDHINGMGASPLTGPNISALGPRFPDMREVYDLELREKFQKAAKFLGKPLREGIYFGIPGPQFETPAEVKLYRQMGADVVGMSTVPEAIALRHMGKRVLAISCATNMSAAVEGCTHQEVLENGKKIQGYFTKILSEFLRGLK